MRRARTGQATVEFSIVIGIFLLVLMGAFEVSRAIYEKQILARAAEVIVKELAQTNPDKQPLDPFTGKPQPYVMSVSDVQAAIAHANTRANLGLSTVWPKSPNNGNNYTDIPSLPGGANTGPQAFDAADGLCDLTPGTYSATCQSAPNQDNSVVVTGYFDLNGPDTIRVTVSQPYKSILEYPLQFLGGNASETVSATTLNAQQQQ